MCVCVVLFCDYHHPAIKAHVLCHQSLDNFYDPLSHDRRLSRKLLGTGNKTVAVTMLLLLPRGNHQLDGEGVREA